MNQLILGAGNMVSALLPNYIKASKDTFSIYTPSVTRAKSFAEKHSINLAETLEGKYDVIWLGFKPQMLNSIDIASYAHKDTIIISLLAGSSVEALSAHAKVDKVIRLMPNTPSKVGFGVNLVYANFSSEWLNQFKSDFSHCGDSFYLNHEEEIDMITPFSGSGPAYIFEFSRIFEKKLSSFGFDSKLAREIIAKTFRGASEMLVLEEDDSETLRRNVTSKGGVTYEALKVFSDSGIEDVFFKAMDEALRRNEELKNLT